MLAARLQFVMFRFNSRQSHQFISARRRRRRLQVGHGVIVRDAALLAEVLDVLFFRSVEAITETCAHRIASKRTTK